MPEPMVVFDHIESAIHYSLSCGEPLAGFAATRKAGLSVGHADWHPPLILSNRGYPADREDYRL